MRFRSPAVILVLLGYCLARPENIVNEIEKLYTEIGALANDADTESTKESLETEERWQEDNAIGNDPEIQEIAERDYETPMGRIIAVNLAHWRKRQQKRTEQAQKDKLDYPGNVEENIEMANEENGFYFNQGDMIMDCELYEELHPGKSCKGERRGETRTKRNAIRERKRLWTSRIIPFRVPSYMSHIKNNLMQAIGNIHRNTCLRFVPYRGQKNYIEFGNKDGCSSRVGKRYAEAGRQTVSLGDGCNHVGTIIHELLHALGFFHEQARGNRDQFVKIKWENILDGFSSQFDKYTYKTIEMIGKDYDFRSIMHYDRKAFTKNGLDTIERIDQSNQEFGMPDHSMSPLDIIELNTLYDCKTKNYGWTQWSAFTPCNDDCKKERQRYCYHSGNPKACGGNVNVYGIETQEVKCGRHECPAPVNGNWGRWSDWRKCDAQCDNGKRKRTRMCDNPEPKNGGRHCPGSREEEEVCIIKRCHLGYDDTDFETGMGMWKNIGQIQWRRNQFFTKTMDTGPAGDHTTGQGYYLYIESSFPAKAGNRAIIESNLLTAPKGGQCLKFFYSMYGKTVGSLSVVLQIGRSAKSIFYKKGEQGINWNGARTSLDVPEGQKFQIKIIAQISNVGYSDIAIDDVYIDPGLCSCQDDYVSCSKWKADGYCNRNAIFMRQHCARSCEACECKDDNVNCPGWAALPNGCENNRAFMRVHCQKSCKVCGNKASTMCKDADEKQCPGWAKMGECTKNPLFMNKNCALSCGTCVCKDKNPRCPEWALKKKQCLVNRDWMFDNCARSCHVCACGDNHVKCGLWARNGECGNNKVFMEEQCKKSCGKC